MSDSTTPPDDIPPMDMWVVYDHPKDFPKHYVARRWEICAPNPPRPTSDYVADPELETLRNYIGGAGFTPIDRFPGDDPCIVECWI